MSMPIKNPLDALAATAKKATAGGGETLLRNVPVEQIVRDPKQPRIDFDKTKLQELAESIKVTGLQSPITCKSVGKNYMIIDGERRWRALELAGIKTASIILRQATGDEHDKIRQLVMNTHRRELSSYEEAIFMVDMQKEFNLSNRDLAKFVSKDEGTVSKLITIGKFMAGKNPADEPLRQKIRAGELKGLTTIYMALQAQRSGDNVVEMINSSRGASGGGGRISRQAITAGRAGGGGARAPRQQNGGAADIDPPAASNTAVSVKKGTELAHGGRVFRIREIRAKGGLMEIIAETAA